MLKTLTALAVLFASPVAAQDVRCFPAERAQTTLSQRYGESPRFTSKCADVVGRMGMCVFYQNTGTGTWTWVFSPAITPPASWVPGRPRKRARNGDPSCL